MESKWDFDQALSVVFLDPSYRLIFASGRALEDLGIQDMSGYDADSFSLEEMIGKEAYQALVEGAKESIKQNKSIRGHFSLLEASGEEIQFEVNVAPVYDYTGNWLLGISVISYELTEMIMLKEEVSVHIDMLERAKRHAEVEKEQAQLAKQRAEKEKERAVIEKKHAQLALGLAEKTRKMAEMHKKKADDANEAKTLFLTSMSHEIKKTLNSIEAAVKAIKDGSQDEKIKEQTESILKNTALWQEIVNDVLDLSQIETEKFSIVPEHFHLHRMIESINDEIAALANEKGLHYQALVSDNIPEAVFADGERIKRILRNILHNAVKFTPEGTVTFEVKTVNDQKLLFKIIDSGTGIKESNIAFVFDTFKQFSKDESITGTGLGLSIAKRLCDQMKGNISVSSTYGIGTTFRVELPFKKGSITRL